jgi:hypothetical protein
MFSMKLRIVALLGTTSFSVVKFLNVDTMALNGRIGRLVSRCNLKTCGRSSNARIRGMAFATRSDLVRHFSYPSYPLAG